MSHSRGAAGSYKYFDIEGSVGLSFVGALLIFPFLQEKDVVDALEGRAGDGEPPIVAVAAAQEMVVPDVAEN